MKVWWMTLNPYATCMSYLRIWPELMCCLGGVNPFGSPPSTRMRVLKVTGYQRSWCYHQSTDETHRSDEIQFHCIYIHIIIFIVYIYIHIYTAILVRSGFGSCLLMLDFGFSKQMSKSFLLFCSVDGSWSESQQGSVPPGICTINMSWRYSSTILATQESLVIQDLHTP